MILLDELSSDALNNCWIF